AAGLDTVSTDNAAKKLRAAFGDFLRTRTPDREAERRSLADFDRVLSSLLERADYGESRPLVRHLRPAWRVLDQDCQNAEHALRHTLPRVLQYEPALPDPAVLTAVAAHRRALDDLEDLSRVGASLARPRTEGGAPTPAPAEPRAPDAP